MRRVQEWVPYSARVRDPDACRAGGGRCSVLGARRHRRPRRSASPFEASWEEGVPIRGASTITQQLAKNLYLSSSRDSARGSCANSSSRAGSKRRCPKSRIFEIYLNVIEWGDGIWGADAAARTYFGIPASALNAEQSALLAGAIINPRLHSPARPTARLLAASADHSGSHGAGRVRRLSTERPLSPRSEDLPVFDKLQRPEIVDDPFVAAPCGRKAAGRRGRSW